MILRIPGVGRRMLHEFKEYRPYKATMSGIGWLAQVCAFALLAPAELVAQAAARSPKLAIELEGGAVWQTRNVVEIPNDGSATRFSLADVTGKGPWPAARLYATLNVAERHGLRLLAAPFSLTETGQLDEIVRFAGATYAPAQPVEATYTFNSYRLSYRYRFHAGSRSAAWVGFTGKIRDAEIALEQGSTTSRKDDLGFVPLLHVAGDWSVTTRWRLGLDVDGLAGGPGRAVDAALKLGYDNDGPWRIQIGYRTLEGGADVPDVYSFAWLHYAVASIVWRVR